MFLYTLRFNIEEQEAKLLEKFFFYKEIKSIKEEKNEKLDKIKLDLINDTKEQDTILYNKIGLDKIDKTDEESKTQILLSRNNTQIQILRQKYKS